MPSRCERGVQRGQQMAARAVEAAVGVGHAARLGGDDQVAARHQPLHAAARAGTRPRRPPYTSAVSTRVPPASQNAFSWSAASCSSVSRPQVSVPSPIRDTRRPVRPRCLCSMNAEITGRNRPSGLPVDNRDPAGAYARRSRRALESPAQATLLIGKGSRPCGSGSTSATGAPEWTRTTSPSPRRPTGSATPSAGPPRRTAPTPPPCSPGSPPRPSASTSARPSSRSRPVSPAMTAMTAATLDSLSGGRFRLGLGVSGPAGLRGLVRRQVRQAAGPHPRVRRDRPQGDDAASGCPTRASTGRCRCPAAPASRSS